MKRLFLSAIAFCLIACHGEEASTKTSPAAPGFEKVQGEDFTLEKPVGWSASRVSPTRFVVSSPDGSAMAAVTAMPLPGKDPLKEIIHLEKWVKSGKVVRSEAPAKKVRRGQLELIDSRNDGPVTANVVVIDGGGVSTVFWASAPRESFARDLPLMAQTLGSFRLVHAPAAAAVAQPRQPETVQYTQWVDPREQAFSTEVPQGWRAEGGLFRVGAIGTRVSVVMSSPDDAVQIILGDMSTPRFILPSDVVCSLGNCNGQPMPNGDIVASFMNAADIGTQIIQRRFGGQPTSRRDRPDIVRFRQQRQPMMGGTINAMTAADVDFNLQDGRIGTATILNSGYQVPGLGGAWSVDDFGAFIAPKDRMPEAARIYGHVIAHTRTNPQWLAAELRSQAAASEQYLAYQRESAALQQKVVEDRWASQDKNAAAWRDALTNTVRLQDPKTGENIEVQSSDRYFFRHDDPAKDIIVGTTTNDNPAPLDMRQLLEAPPS